MPAAVRLATLHAVMILVVVALTGRFCSGVLVKQESATQPATLPTTFPAPPTKPAEPEVPPTRPADPPPAAVTADMSYFGWMVGTWEGEGWVMLVPGRREPFEITERVETRLDGQVLLIDGYGTATDETGTVQPVHETFAVISFDAQEQNFSFRAIRKSTGQLDPAFQLMPGGGFDWSFEIVAGERKAVTRYAVRRLEDGRWQEKGFLSLDDGKTWAQFFEMTLQRIEDAPATRPATTPAPAAAPTAAPASQPATLPVSQ